MESVELSQHTRNVVIFFLSFFFPFIIVILVLAREKPSGMTPGRSPVAASLETGAETLIRFLSVPRPPQVNNTENTGPR